METRNITLSLPEDVLREAKVVAARRGTSVSALLAGALSEIENARAGTRRQKRGAWRHLAQNGTLAREER